MQIPLIQALEDADIMHLTFLNDEKYIITVNNCNTLQSLAQSLSDNFDPSEILRLVLNTMSM